MYMPEKEVIHVISLETAKRIAARHFKKRGYEGKPYAAVDIGNNKVVFHCRMFKEPGPEYGNCPAVVDLNTGTCQPFPFIHLENFNQYNEGHLIELD